MRVERFTVRVFVASPLSCSKAAWTQFLCLAGRGFRSEMQRHDHKLLRDERFMQHAQRASPLDVSHNQSCSASVSDTQHS